MTNLGEFQLLFQDHILTVFLWASAWGLIDMCLECFASDSRTLRALILISIFIISAQAIARLSKKAQLIEKEELRQLINELRNASL